MNQTSLLQFPARTHGPIVVVRLQYQTLPHPPMRKGLPRRLTRLTALVSGAFYPARGRTGFRNFLSRFQFRQEPKRGLVNAFFHAVKSLTHAVNHNDEGTRVCGKVSQGRGAFSHE